MSVEHIKSGPYNIVASGTVITFLENPIEILLKTTSGEELNLIFNFEVDSTNKETRLDKSVENDGKKLTIRFINVPDEIGGNSSPWEVGNSEDKKLYLNVTAVKVGGSRTVDYSIYEEE